MPLPWKRRASQEAVTVETPAEPDNDWLLGLSFAKPLDAWDFLVANEKAPAGQPILAIAQETQDQFKSCIFLGAERGAEGVQGALYMVCPHPDANCEFFKFRLKPDLRVTTIQEDGEDLLLVAHPKKGEYSIGKLGKTQITRLLDAIQMLREGRLTIEDDRREGMPDGFAFLDVEPLEFYAARMGPNAEHLIQEHAMGNLVVRLGVITKEQGAYFLLRSFRRNPDGSLVANHEGNGGLFKENNATQLVQKLRVEVVASGRTAEAALAELGITDRGADLPIQKRFVHVKPVSSLDRCMEALRAAGLRKGKAGFQILDAEGGKYLSVGNRLFYFDANGDSVTIEQTKPSLGAKK